MLTVKNFGKCQIIIIIILKPPPQVSGIEFYDLAPKISR